MKGLLIILVIFVVAMFGLKSCKGKDGAVPGAGLFGGGKAAPGTTAATPAPAPGGKVSEPVSGSKGPGYVIRVEKFKGWIGKLAQLRTDQGQYTAGKLCAHGLVLALDGYTVKIQGGESLVYVVAVDDYPAPRAEPILEVVEDVKPGGLAGEPVAPPNVEAAKMVPMIVRNSPGISGARSDYGKPAATPSPALVQRRAARGIVDPFGMAVQVPP